MKEPTQKSSWASLASESTALRRKAAALITRLKELIGSADEHISATTVMDREASEWRQLAEQLNDTMGTAASECKRLAKKEAEDFEQRLRRQLEGGGHTVIGEGQQWVVDGSVYLELNLKDGHLKMNGRVLSTLAVPAVVGEITLEAKELKRKLTPRAALARQLYDAYTRQRAIDNKPIGAQLYLTAVYSQLVLLRQPKKFSADPSAQNFVPYPLAQFRADLFELMSAADPVVVDGQRFKHSSGWDTSGAIFMLVPALGRPAHVARIAFEVET
jgi:hypothetical protein